MHTKTHVTLTYDLDIQYASRRCQDTCSCNRLKSRRPVWLEGLQQEEVSTRQKWNEEWATSDVTNHSLVVDPSIAPPGFDLRRRLWSTSNHFRTGQGRCAANLVRWNQTSDPSCSCGASYRLCYILWTIVQIWNSSAVCQPCIWLSRRLSPGSACRAHAKKMRTYYAVSRSIMHAKKHTKNPRDPDIRPMTSKFNKLVEVVKVHGHAKFHPAKCSGYFVDKLFLPYPTMVKKSGHVTLTLDIQ